MNLIDYTRNIKYVKIFSDSQAALLALSNKEMTQKTVISTCDKLNCLSAKIKYLTLAWTRGHVGNIGNERADELAKAGTLKEEVTDVEKPLCHARGIIRKHFERKWNDEWLNYREARMSKKFLNQVDMNKSKKLMTYGRSKLGTLIRIITGHNRLNYFGSKIDTDLDPECRFCGEDDETYWHLATDCPVFWAERNECFGRWCIKNGCWTAEALLNFAGTIKIAKALEGYSDIWFENSTLDVSDDNEPEPEPD
jgi:hypothetical protein